MLFAFGNAKKIVEQCPPDKDLLFVPDENLGQWVMEQTDRPMTLWQGNCYVHVEWTHAAITKIRDDTPTHPLSLIPNAPRPSKYLQTKCAPPKKMVHYCRDVESDSVIIATEAGMLHRLQKSAPIKNSFLPRLKNAPATSVTS